MNKRTFTDITKEEFEEALAETQYDFKEVNYDWSGEAIYEEQSPQGKFTLRVYSSIDKRTEELRDKGSDAIRTVVLHTETDKPVLKEKRTNRIKTWKKNLQKKIDSLTSKSDELNICDECGSVMVIRENKVTGNQFLGCTGYPDCENTESL